MKRGFTLVELLVVIAVVSILSASILTSLSESRTKARDSRRIKDVHAIIKALQLYAADRPDGRFPCAPPLYSTEPDFLQVLVDGNYLSTNPHDPINVYPLLYIYVTYKPYVGGPCGTFFEINYDIEHENTSCILGGKLVSSSHCHIFFPTPLPCSEPWMESHAPDCLALQD